LIVFLGSPKMVKTGAERLLTDENLLSIIKNRKWALICHQASVDSNANHLFDLVCADDSLRPQRLLVPEHGLFGEQLYMEAVEDVFHERLQVPVSSLYGNTFESLTPKAHHLDGLDLVVFDLQDVGARYYTYLATMTLAMEACSKAKIQFVVLDRPNPIGGALIEGNIPLPTLKSFVSYLPVPNRHGMTAGEIAKFVRDQQKMDLELTVIPCKGWERRKLWPETGLPFVPPSPNIPTWETALVYPGMCLLEGTNISEGRGTTMPFFLFGAPWITNPTRLVEELNSQNLAGVRFRETAFTPSHDKGANSSCKGAQLIVTDIEQFRPLVTGLVIIATIFANYPDDFALRTDTYEFVDDVPALDLLLGDSSLREALLNGVPGVEIARRMRDGRRDFIAIRERYLLYR